MANFGWLASVCVANVGFEDLIAALCELSEVGPEDPVVQNIEEFGDAKDRAEETTATTACRVIVEDEDGNPVKGVAVLLCDVYTSNEILQRQTPRCSCASLIGNI